MSYRTVKMSALALLLAAALAPAARADTALFDLNAPGPAVADPEDARLVLGTRVIPYENSWASGIAFYAPAGHRLSGTWVYLWEDGRLIASDRAPDFGSATGWVRVKFRDGLHNLRPGHEYVVAYLAERGHYAATEGYFNLTSGPARLGLQVPPDGGVYRDLGGPESPVGIPQDTWNASNYWVTPYYERAEGPFVPTTTGPWALYNPASALLPAASEDGASLELGARFTIDAPFPGYVYQAKAVRFYRSPGAGMVENHVRLYDGDGNEIARGAAIGEGGRIGWVDVLLDAPVTLHAGETYTASYLAPGGGYTDTTHGFDFPIQAGPMTFPRDAGVYHYGGGGFPTDAWESSDYHVTPIVELVKSR